MRDGHAQRLVSFASGHAEFAGDAFADYSREARSELDLNRALQGATIAMKRLQHGVKVFKAGAEPLRDNGFRSVHG